MTKAEASALIEEAQRLLGFIGAELGEDVPNHQTISTLSLAARTALRKVTDQFGAALELDT